MRELKDILHPKIKHKILSPIKIEPTRHASTNHSFKIAKWTITIIIITVVSFYVIKIINVGKSTKSSGVLFIERIKEGTTALQNLNTLKATNAFMGASSALIDIKKSSETTGIATILNLGENLIPKLKDLPLALNDLIAFTANLFSLSQNLDALKSQAYHMAFNGEGFKIIKSLRTLNVNIAAISELSKKLSAYALNFKIPLPENYLALTVNLHKTENILKSMTRGKNKYFIGVTILKNFICLFKIFLVNSI